MVVALLSLELHIAGARSLKDKRMVLRSVKDRLRAFNVAVAELEHQDLWQRAGLGVVTVAGTEALAERELRNVVERAALLGEGEVLEPHAFAESVVPIRVPLAMATAGWSGGAEHQALR